jgi:hypothetical protein
MSLSTAVYTALLELPLARLLGAASQQDATVKINLAALLQRCHSSGCSADADACSHDEIMSVLQDLTRPGLTSAYLQHQLQQQQQQQTSATGGAGSNSSGISPCQQQTPAAGTVQDTEVLLNNGTDTSGALWVQSLDVSHLSQMGLLGWQKLLGVLQETDCLRQLVARDCGIVAANASECCMSQHAAAVVCVSDFSSNLCRMVYTS